MTLTTDFGWEDPYVGMLKGVLLKRLNAYVVDITHGIKKFSIRSGAFVVYKSYAYFPRGSYHLAVVDPGVGGKRKIIALKSKDGHTFVGPDNGIFSFLFNHGLVEKYQLFEAEKLTYPRVGRTFQARDIMANLLADIALGKVAIKGTGEPPTVFIPVKKEKENGILFEIVYIDSFGNCVTNLRRDDIKGRFSIDTPRGRVEKILSSYEEGEKGEVFLIEGGFGLMEISMNMESAADKLKLKVGDTLFLKWL